MASKISMDNLPEVIRLRKEYIRLSMALIDSSREMSRAEIDYLFEGLRRHINALEQDIIKLNHGF